MSVKLKAKIIKIYVPNFLYPNNFDCLMKVFELMKINKNDITYKSFKEDKTSRIVRFCDDESNLKIKKLKNGICMYYKHILAM